MRSPDSHERRARFERLYHEHYPRVLAYALRRSERTVAVRRDLRVGRTDFVRFGVLEATAANRQLLRIAPPPGARVLGSGGATSR